MTSATLELLDLEDADEEVLKHVVKERGLQVTYNGVKVTHDMVYVDENQWDGKALWQHVAQHVAHKDRATLYDYEQVNDMFYDLADQCLYAEEKWSRKSEEPDGLVKYIPVYLRYEHTVARKQLRVKVLRHEEYTQHRKSSHALDLNWVR